MNFDFKNIAMIMLALVGFVVASTWIDVMAGIVVLVFVAGGAAVSYSWTRNIKISLGLIAVAFAFQKFLGLNLRML